MRGDLIFSTVHQMQATEVLLVYIYPLSKFWKCVCTFLYLRLRA